MWEPLAAPTWELPKADGATVSLDDYRGRPVVIIFYLGLGCLHCVEQLEAFAPMAEAYADAGIELVGISTDGLVKPSGIGRALLVTRFGAGVSVPPGLRL